MLCYEKASLENTEVALLVSKSPKSTHTFFKETDTVESLYLDYPLSRTSLYVEPNIWSLKCVFKLISSPYLELSK